MGAFVVALLVSHAAAAQNTSARSSRGRLIGAWHLVRIAPDADGKSAPGPQPKGMLAYTRDGHMSVQLMYPATEVALSNEYVRDGYEASFGTYEVNESAHTVTHHVQGSVTRDQLVGKDLPRKFEFTADGHLLIRSTRPDEHWSVTWAHD
ncbi:MAG: lipocalin-like domain-containing protein [Granulicella sp.]